MDNNIVLEFDSIEEVVKIINSGGINGALPIKIAGQYACQLSPKYDDVLDDGFIADKLDELADFGAKFNRSAAMDHARYLKGMRPTAYALEDYIKINFKAQIVFATHQEVKPPQITQWIEKKYIVVNDVLYSPRRDLSYLTADQF